MSIGQEKIREFPEDGAFWFVKWIDEFRIPHLGTRSASVAVILQKLPFKDLSELSRLPPDRLLQILGQRSKKDPEVEVLARNPVVMPGTLPLLNIGAIFYNKVRVGELPVRRKRLELWFGGQEGDEITLGEQLTPPKNWTAPGPYRLLNKYEYSIAPFKMPRSRCLVIKRRGQTIVIPRMTIFKTFYAPHTELAKAFCNGPWEDRHEDVICLSDFESGLKTEKDPSGQWNVILQTKVPDTFAELLALFYFDEFARKCASSIYAKSLQDRNGRMSEPWYASAQIPFRWTDQKLTLDVRGFQLRSWKYRDDDDTEAEHQKFLVTDIVGSSWPSYIPQIGYERANSGNGSPNPIKVEGSAPFLNNAQEKNSDTETEVDGEHDANAASLTTHMSVTEFGWLNQPKKAKLQKKSSKQYSDKSRPAPATNGSKVSTGELTHQQDTQGTGQAEVRVRAPEKRFQHILEAFEKLTKKGFLNAFDVVPCTTPGKQVRRGDLDCWSFIDALALTEGHRPRRGWRLAEYDKESPKNCIYRTALVVRLTIGEKTHYWIEIECRKRNEGGFRSPLLSNVDTDTQEVILGALEVIVEMKGINMEAPLNELLGGVGVHADCYKHVYEPAPSSKFDITSIQRFLTGR